MAKSKKSVQEKVQAEFPEFVTDVAGLSVDQLNTKLATLAKGLEESEECKDNDEELEKTKLLAAELSAPYRDIKKAVGLKTKYVISLIKEKGGE
jgi:hypothetical protein